jgi:hypothetical protein
MEKSNHGFYYETKAKEDSVSKMLKQECLFLEENTKIVIPSDTNGFLNAELESLEKCASLVQDEKGYICVFKRVEHEVIPYERGLRYELPRISDVIFDIRVEFDHSGWRSMIGTKNGKDEKDVIISNDVGIFDLRKEKSIQFDMFEKGVVTDLYDHFLNNFNFLNICATYASYQSIICEKHEGDEKVAEGGERIKISYALGYFPNIFRDALTNHPNLFTRSYLSSLPPISYYYDNGTIVV